MTASGGQQGPAPALLPDVFERSARRHADRVAVEVPPSSGRPRRDAWTYAQLARARDLLSRALAPRLAGESIVAILLPRESLHLFAAQLGVLRAGAAWTCVDPGYPDEHVRFLLEDARPVALLTDARGASRARDLGFPADRVLDVEVLLSAGVAPGDPPCPSSPTDGALAYVIYTSGTTGRPKGVMVEHRSIANLVADDVDVFGLGPDDRVALVSSPAYDSSVEETWLAFAAGATLVVLDDETARLGPDLVPWLRSERVTVFCPPPTLLRATGCDDPQAALPDLRLLYLGGEALPDDLAHRWARGRRLVNGYGPTECTVTAMRATVVDGRSVTIGTPVAGNRAYVLDDRLEPVPDGEPGELCLAGVGLARGYLGRPELTAERFPVHPRLGRIYRTGDLAQRRPDGEHLYLGRIDGQVKLRGHRVELGAVEAALAACPGVRAAACRVQGEGSAQVLAGHVVPADPSRPPSFADLEAALRRDLPSHMVPGRFALARALPTNRNGKLDRKALPEVDAPSCARDRRTVAPRDDLERRIAAAVRTTLGLADAVSVEDDFFLDLGGTSLAAAGVVSALRRDPVTAALAVRDLYDGRTVAALARRVRDARASQAGRVRDAGAGQGRPLLATAVQGAWLLLTVLPASAALYAAWHVLVPALLAHLGLLGSLLVAPFLFVLARLLHLPLAVGALVLAKRVLIGRYRAGRSPAWSGFHVRHWIVRHVAGMVPWSLLQDTALLGPVLRALGARVGRRVHVHRGVDLRQGGWDLLEIEDDVSVEQEAALRLVDLEDGHLVVGPVTLRAGATLEVRAGVSAGTEVGEGAILTALSWLPPGGRIPAGERWDGVPARPVGPVPPVPRPSEAGAALSPAWHGALTLLLRLGGGVVAFYGSCLLLAAAGVAGLGVDTAAVLSWWSDPLSAPGFSAGVLALVVVSGPLSLLLSGVGARTLGRVRPGVLDRYGLAYLRVLAKADAVQGAGMVLAGTLYWPLWLRLAGMRIGRKGELSTIIDVVPECVEIGDETFLADGIYLGGPRLRHGTATVATTRLGRSCFLGNHVVVPAGTTLPDDVLLGVCTVADGGRARRGTSWFGHPAFELPRREVVEMDRRLTHDPGPLRYLTRLFWETARFALPVVPLSALLWWAHLTASRTPGESPLLLALAVAPGAALLGTVALCLLAVVAKWALLGRVRPGQHAFWSCWCGRWDFVYVAWEAWARWLVANLEGTLLLAGFLRAMGCRIGRRVLLGDGFAQVVDPDMLDLEDGATVNAQFQAHSFEDRVLKIDRVLVRRGSSVGDQAVLLYGAHVGEDAWVAPHSVVMKHETLLPGRAYAGCPTERYETASSDDAAASGAA